MCARVSNAYMRLDMGMSKRLHMSLTILIVPFRNLPKYQTILIILWRINCVVRKLAYGLRQGKKAFADDFSNTVVSAGFTKCIDPSIFKKIRRYRNGVIKRCYVYSHVHDRKSMLSCHAVYDHLISVLENSYGLLKQQPLSSYTGTTFARHSNDALSFSLARRLYTTLLQSINIYSQFGHIKGTTRFWSLFLKTLRRLPPWEVKLYRSITGSLIHILITRSGSSFWSNEGSNCGQCVKSCSCAPIASWYSKIRSYLLAVRSKVQL